jgi:predicted Ser/Thr protein kinase
MNALDLKVERIKQIPMDLFCDDVKLTEFGQRWAITDANACKLDQLQFLLIMAFLVNDVRVTQLVLRYERAIKHIHMLTDGDITKLQRMGPSEITDFVDRIRDQRLKRARKLAETSKDLENLMKEFPRLRPPEKMTRETENYLCRRVIRQMGTFFEGWTMLKYLGGGSYGKVFLMNTPEGKSVAVKLQRVDGNQVAIEEEVDAQALFNRFGLAPKVISHAQARIARQNVVDVIVMTPVEYTLREVLCMAGNDKRKVRSVVRQIMDIMKKMEDHNLTHGDMHAGNFGFRTVGGKLNPVLIDFGFASGKIHFPEIDAQQMVRILANPDFGTPYPHLHILVDAFEEYLEDVGSDYELNGSPVYNNHLLDEYRRVEIKGFVPANPQARTPPRAASKSRARTPSRAASKSRARTPSRAASKSRARKPCREDQHRNPDTGRCRKTCREDQHRNPDTGRCRKTCREDQHRNQDTGRCRKGIPGGGN